jgi:hypothetical protein
VNVYFTGVLAPAKLGHHTYLNGAYLKPTQTLTPWGRPENPLLELATIHPDATRYSAPKAQPEGVLYIDRRPGWVCMACWDCSADTRGGSSATWAVTTDDVDEALRAVREYYALTVVRIERHVGKPIAGWQRHNLWMSGAERQ